MPRKYLKKNARKRYDENNFKLAIEAVSSGCSIREATIRFHVPYTTLNSHVNNYVLYDRIGRPTKFTTEEERCLEQAALLLQVRQFFPRVPPIFLIDALNIKGWGVPLTIEEFLDLSRTYASSLNKSHLFPLGRPTYDWLYSFLKRHKNLVLKKSYPLEKKRAVVTEEQVDRWFLLLGKIIEDNDLANRPAQIFNCDESGKNY